MKWTYCWYVCFRLKMAWRIWNLASSKTLLLPDERGTTFLMYTPTATTFRAPTIDILQIHALEISNQRLFSPSPTTCLSASPYLQLLLHSTAEPRQIRNDFALIAVLSAHFPDVKHSRHAPYAYLTAIANNSVTGRCEHFRNTDQVDSDCNSRELYSEIDLVFGYLRRQFSSWLFYAGPCMQNTTLTLVNASSGFYLRYTQRSEVEALWLKKQRWFVFADSQMSLPELVFLIFCVTNRVWIQNCPLGFHNFDIPEKMIQWSARIARKMVTLSEFSLHPKTSLNLCAPIWFKGKIWQVIVELKLPMAAIKPCQVTRVIVKYWWGGVGDWEGRDEF